MKIVYMLLSCLIPVIATSTSDLEQIFTNGYQDWVINHAGEYESISGPGSSMEQTEVIRAFIPKIIEQFTIKSIIDAPCGDFYWMSSVDLKNASYLGIDIIRPLIEKDTSLYASSQHAFIYQDLLAEVCPPSDLIISRDFFVHLSNADVFKALGNFKKSGSKYLLTTTFTKRANHDINSGSWRPINLQNPPFNFPEPLILVSENCTEQHGIFADKSFALWDLRSISV